MTDARSRVEKIALHFFAKKGYAATSVQEIADAAKVTKPVIYYYFQSKAGLFKALIDLAMDQRMNQMEEAVRGVSGFEAQITALFVNLGEFAKKNRDLMRVCFNVAFAPEEETPLENHFRQRAKKSFEFVYELVSQGMQNGELDSHYETTEVAASIFGLLLHYMRREVLADNKLFPRRNPRRIIELFLHGAGQKMEKETYLISGKSFNPISLS